MIFGYQNIYRRDDYLKEKIQLVNLYVSMLIFNNNQKNNIINCYYFLLILLLKISF